MGKRIATKIKEELKKMNNSTDLGYTKTISPGETMRDSRSNAQEWMMIRY